MDNKILVKVIVPVLEQNYDVFIPISKTVFQITELLKKGINDLSEGVYQSNEVAIYNSLGVQLDPNIIMKDSGITNGSTLIII